MSKLIDILYSSVLPIKFNPHKFSFVRYVFVQSFGGFRIDENDPVMTHNDSQNDIIYKISQF